MAGTSLSALASVAHAQATAGPTATSNATPPAIEEVVVTASRADVAGFAAPTPTTVVGSAAIQQRQITNIASMLNEIPAFRPTTTPSANAIRTQQPGTNTADLRGLGAQRTLVLVDGHRVVPNAAANNNGAPVAVDLNQIPTLMIDGVEVVTGGAAAQWGSDAVSGVVNVILKNHFQGLQIRLQGGISQVGDGSDYRIATLWGTSFAGGQGHVVAGFDWDNSDKIGDIYSRDWGRQEAGLVSNSAFATNGLPANIITTNVHSALAPGGLITTPGLSVTNYTFLPGGAGIRPYNLGTIRDATQMIGGEGPNVSKGISLAPGVQRFDPYLHVEYDLGKLTAFLEASYAISVGRTTVLPSRSPSISISADNAFLPAAVRTALGTRSTFTMNRINYDFGNAGVTVDNRTPHVNVGARGDLGSDWNWDVSAGYGRNFYTNEVFPNRIAAKYNYASDAVLSNGQIVCGATIPGRTNPFTARAYTAADVTASAGCVPINLFGDGSPSQAAISYVVGKSHLQSAYTQQTGAANLRGKPFSTWAGPVSVAVGAEYRRESQSVGADPIALAAGYEASNGSQFTGAFEVKEAYAETIVPLLKDMRFADSLDVNGAVRVADYSTAGTQTTWKIGSAWEVVNGLRLRVTNSLDIRAPAIFELYSPGAVSNLPVAIGPITASNIPQNPGIGNPNLTPEQAHTFTVGGVLQPKFLRGFSVSVDYYDINLKNAITTISGAVAGQLCARGDQHFCSLFTYSAAGVPTSYAGQFINIAANHQQGLDIVANYSTPLERLGLPGTLNVGFNGTYIFHDLSDTGTGTLTENAGNNSSTPQFRSNTSITYSTTRFDATLQVLTISPGRIVNNTNATNLSYNLNKVPGYARLNTQLSYRLNNNVRVFGSVDNLLDRDPPLIPNATLFTATNGSFYDVVGRAFRVGMDLQF